MSRHHAPRHPPLAVLCAAGLAACWLYAAAASAQLPGTLYGSIFDEKGQGIEGVKITITDPDNTTFKQEESSGKGGRYTIFVPSTLPAYTVAFEKSGYQPFSVSAVKMVARQRTRRNFDMMSVAAAVAAAPGGQAAFDQAEAGKGDAVKSYNVGVQAYNAGQFEDAVTAFNLALGKNAELAQAQAALARTYRQLGNHQEALAAAEKAIAANQDTNDMQQVLFDAYTSLGQTDKANAALAAMKSGDPSKASLNLFNQAAELYNRGDMAQAKSSLEQVIQLDPNHAKAHYLLALCVAGEDAPRAKQLLEKFIALAPEDPDAETAKEMIKYL